MIKKLLKSRQIWTIVVLVLINGINSISDMLTPQAMEYINPVLGLLAIYFRVSPNQKFTR